MALATVAHIEAVLGEDLDDTRATTLIGLAEEQVVGYLDGQLLETATGHEADIVGLGTTRLWLPQRPGTAITSIVDSDAATVAAASYRLHNRGWYVEHLTGLWTLDETYTVTYNYGSAALTALARAVVVDLVARNFTTSPGLVQETEGGYSSTAAGVGHTLELGRGHRRSLNRIGARLGLRPQAIGSVTIGAPDSDWRDAAFPTADIRPATVYGPT